MHNMIIICRCGRIHRVLSEDVEKVAGKRKKILLVCTHCNGQYILDAQKTEDGNFLYKSSRLPLTPPNQRKMSDTARYYAEVKYSRGYRVPMESGYYATWYNGSYFQTDKTYSLDLIKWYMSCYNYTLDEAYEKLKKDSCIVDMCKFLNETPKDVLEDISKYNIKAFDWTGTIFNTPDAKKESLVC